MPLGTAYKTYGAQGQVWFGAAPTTGGVATFYPTDDGTATGVPLFTNIAVVFSGASANIGAGVAVALTGTKLIAADRKSVTVNCVVGTTLLALGDTLIPAPDGTVVTCQLWGQ
jgi:hypothetical protein